MNVTLSDIETKVRCLIDDFSRSGKDVFTYDTSAIFTITEDNVVSVSTVYINSVEIGASEYSFDSDTNKLTISASLTAGDTVEIDYTYYSNYSSAEIQSYIHASLVHISANNYYDFKIENDVVYPEPDDREENLIALITALLIEPDNKSYSLPDMRVTVPSDLPTYNKIGKAIAIFKKNTHGLLDVIDL